MSLILTKRDMAVVMDVYTYRYLSVDQVQRLRFPSLRTAYRRLHILVELGLLKAFTVPSISGRIFYLGKSGAELIASELDVLIEDLHWYKHTKVPKDYYFLRHFLAINDFRITLTTACQRSALTLTGFTPEYIGEKTSKGHVKKHLRDTIDHLSHTPDAAFALEKDGKAALFFLEIDRGNEVVSDPEKGFLKAMVFYLNYWNEGKLRKYEQEFLSIRRTKRPKA